MSNTIHLPIKREWFDMILSGEKKEEYRNLERYWARRLMSVSSFWTYSYLKKSHREGDLTKFDFALKFGSDTTATLTNGYGNHRPRIVVELLGLEIKHPNPAWCPHDTEGLWFALKLGEVLETHNLPVLAVR